MRAEVATSITFNRHWGKTIGARLSFNTGMGKIVASIALKTRIRAVCPLMEEACAAYIRLSDTIPYKQLIHCKGSREHRDNIWDQRTKNAIINQWSAGQQ